MKLGNALWIQLAGTILLTLAVSALFFAVCAHRRRERQRQVVEPAQTQEGKLHSATTLEQER